MNLFVRVFLLSLVAAPPLLAADDFVRGKITDPLASVADPAVTYAYYLPSHYDPASKWPVLFVFDARSRGAFAAGLFEDVAEERGWIVVSSNNTMSDTAAAPSLRAIATMGRDVERRFAIDPRRIYTTGFSGGAVLCWMLSYSWPIAGIISSSGRPISDRDAEGVSFDWYGLAGTIDFNYTPTRQVERSLEGKQVAARTEFFEGGHRWAPKESLRRAVEWMELQAMKRGTCPRDAALIERLLHVDQAQAAALTDPLLAMRQYAAIARTFDGLAPVTELRERAAALARTPEVRKLLADERKADAFEDDHRRLMTSVFAEFLAPSDEARTSAWLLRALRVPSLRETAKEPTYRGTAARRVLANLASNLGFYFARELRTRGDVQRLAVVTDAAKQLQATQQAP